ncbi:FG-GAP repeat domain-containing protein [Bacteroides coprosuis]|uniref:FG-GAP repeat domain-containing protein n=2 Tax=Bacteroides TaxID=816 RepID=UPI001D68A303|nr:VCBS repeat-containing protein [Bacteroides coprosuis]HJD92553.1 VCBS repeat-containing protein [Bacteroides coprosuis]
MKKRILIALSILVVLGLFVSCWNTKKKTNEEGAKDSSLVDIEQPITPNVSQKLSSVVSDELLLDAPTTARYVLSTSAQLAENKLVKFDFNKDGKEEVIVLGRDHPNGVRVLATRKGIGQNLINDITEGYFFDSYGELKSQYAIQVTVVDVNGDNQSEVVVSIGKSGERVDSFFYLIKDTDKGSFNYIGSIKGKNRAELTPNHKIELVNLENQSVTYEIYNNELALVK